VVRRAIMTYVTVWTARFSQVAEQRHAPADIASANRQHTASDASIRMVVPAPAMIMRTRGALQLQEEEQQEQEEEEEEEQEEQRRWGGGRVSEVS
jgi:hypothetical protein